MTPRSTEQLAALLGDVLGSFDRDGEAALLRLVELYHPDVVFRDPLQTLSGRDAFMAMNRRILGRARRLSFAVTSAVAAGDSVFMTWTMSYAPRRGPTFVFEGATHARARGGVVREQRDYWDLLSSVAQSMPVLRRIYAALAPRLG